MGSHRKRQFGIPSSRSYSSPAPKVRGQRRALSEPCDAWEHVEQRAKTSAVMKPTFDEDGKGLPHGDGCAAFLWCPILLRCADNIHGARQVPNAIDSCFTIERFLGCV